MKSRMIGLLAVSLLALGLLGCASQNALSEKFDEDTVKAACEESIGYFNERNYQAIIDMGNQEMKDAITAESFAEQCDPMLDKCGKFNKIEKMEVMGSKDEKAGAEYGGAVAVGAYADGSIQFTIGFDEDMQLVQFIVK